MALDRMDEDLFRDGVPFLKLHTIPRADLETWTQELAKLTETRLDFSQCAGYAVLRAIVTKAEIKERIRKVAEARMNILQQIFVRECVQHYGITESRAKSIQFYEFLI